MTTVEATPASDTTAVLAAFASGVSGDTVDPVARERAKDLLIDAIASALAADEAPETAIVDGFAAAMGTSSESSVIGGGRLSMAGATLANAYRITAVTVCDIHRPTTCHVTPEVVGPALVAGEHAHASGRRLVDAVVAGLEVTTRVGLGLKPEVFRERQWHMPGVAGPFGAAAAVGRIVGLDGDAMNQAFGIAGSQAAGTYVHLGTPTMKFHQSRAALSGLMSATLAARGFRASTDVLADPTGGLFAAYSDGGRPAATVEGLGFDWELCRISFRPWPVAVHLLPVVTGLMALLDQGLQASDVESVRLAISPLADRMHGTVPWDGPFRSRLSARFVTGVVLVDRRCWVEQFLPDRIADPVLDAFVRERITVVADAALANGQADIVVETQDGRTWQERVVEARGEPGNPLRRDEILAKLAATADRALGPTRSAALQEAVAELDDLDDVATLMDRLRSEAP